jgi:DNA-directed RNA polymerase specialized sigma24 family protein
MTDTTLLAGNAMARSPVRKQCTEPSERTLLVGISAGDRSAMNQLYSLYFARLANFFRHLTADTHLVEELINDTMFEVWRRPGAIGANASVAAAIMGLAYSSGQKRLAEVSATPRHDQGLTHRANHNGSRPLTALLELAVEERLVLHLAYAVGHSRLDIADIMNISCESVDTLLVAARRGYSWRCKGRS